MRHERDGWYRVTTASSSKHNPQLVLVVDGRVAASNFDMRIGDLFAEWLVSAERSEWRVERVEKSDG
jgi:hypothetical protein